MKSRIAYIACFGLALMFASLVVSGGTARAALGDITEYPIPTTYAQPYSIVAGPDGNLWFTEFANSAVAR